MVTLVRHDLEFILRQIKLAEAHAGGVPLTALVDSPLLPFGLRTVDGSYNNLVPGREQWGASGEPFLRLTGPSWREGNGEITFGAGSPGEIIFGQNNYRPGADGGSTPSPMIQPGSVVDTGPRIISNLIVDQTLDNPAAIYAGLIHAEVAPGELMEIISAIRNAHEIVKAIDPEDDPDAYEAATAHLEALLDQHGIEMDGPSIRLPNLAPDEGLSSPYNSWFTLFGQFFDHGLDLVAKGGNGTIYIPLQSDDPLYDPDSPHTNFMPVTRASIGADAANVTTPWIDQNQTYTSHPSHQVFLREYVMTANGPVATGKLLEGDRGLATWGDVKEQARTMLGIELTDKDVFAVPLIRTDAYGKFIPDANGFAQVVVGLGPDGIPNTSDDMVVSGTPDNPVSLANAVRTANAFLDDIAHSAVPVIVGGVLQPDGDDTVGYFDENGDVIPPGPRGTQTHYDNEMLDAHYITGDGRGNENIALSAVHHVFHSEHNRMAEHVKAVVTASGDPAFISEWKLDDGSWNGERLFQAARFSTEMQYQHLVVEEFARKIQPDIDVFNVMPNPGINPAIFAEFAHVVYRFGHSMLNETVDRINEDGTRADMTLFDAFLNPLAFGSDTLGHDVAAGAIIRGLTGQVGNEIDEFVTNVLRNQLVGIPLDLAAINIARGRDTGMPTLNEARAQFMQLSGGDTQLKPYDNWSDFAVNMKNPASIVNFIAAYGTHETITEAETVTEKRDAAIALVFGGSGAPSDRLDFLNARGEYAVRKGGLDNVDLWMGGLAEKKMPFGGMLGSTFAFVFELQMENLQDGDRFYYLARTQGLNLLTELENNSLAKMVLRNTDLGETGFALPGDIFSVPDHVLYIDFNKQLQMTGLSDPIYFDPFLGAVSRLVERGENFIRYNGADHVVIMGTDGDDHIIAGGGDDTVWGGAGNDRIEAGYGVDRIHGGDGDDIITNAGTDIGETDFLHGDGGNDVIHGGSGHALIFGGDGQDFLMAGKDGSEVRGGNDNDFIAGGDGPDMLFGGAGDDWIEAGDRADYIAGDHGELFFNSTVIGHDVLNGGGGDTDYDADSGDDIMFAGEGIQKFIGMWGHDWVIHKGQMTAADADMNVEVFTTLPLEVLRDRYSQVEAVSGWKFDDIIRGDSRTSEEEELGEFQIPDPTPEGNFLYNELNQEGIDRIEGLGDIITQALMTEGRYLADGSWEYGRTGTSSSIFVGGNILLGGGGNILLGGGGSDLIEGRGGDDVIDGDAWLNVRISIELSSGRYWADGMFQHVYAWDNFDDATGMAARLEETAFSNRTLDQLMLSRTINPGLLSIHREILWNDKNEDGTDAIDISVYWDVRENYTITHNIEDGSFTVSHDTQTSGAIDPITGKNRVSDGTDTLYNIELLQFADQTIDLRTMAPVPDPLVPDDGDEENTTLDLSTSTANILVNLDSGELTIEETTEAISGIHNVITGSGDDLIIASQEINILDGGQGADTFRFLSAAHADGDTIIGFDVGDRIDLSAMDTEDFPEESFMLITGPFTGRGQIMIAYETREDGDYAIIYGNTTGGDAADFTITIKGSHVFGEADFIF